MFGTPPRVWPPHPPPSQKKGTPAIAAIDQQLGGCGKRGADKADSAESEARQDSHNCSKYMDLFSLEVHYLQFTTTFEEERKTQGPLLHWPPCMLPRAWVLFIDKFRDPLLGTRY